MIAMAQQDTEADETTPRTEPVFDNGTTVVIVGCGSAKADGERFARDLYTSNYYKKKREYAETIGDKWSILSAKWGSLDTHTARVEPYDVTITDYPLDPDEYPDAPYNTLDEWGSKWLSGIENRIANYERWDDHEPLGEMVLLLGQDYLGPIQEGLEELAAEHDFELIYPFYGTGGNGEQMQVLGNAVEEYEQASAASHETDTASESDNEGSTESADPDPQSGLDVWSV